MQRWSHSKNRKQPKKTRRMGEMRKVRAYLEPRAACGEWWVEKVMEKLECFSKDLWHYAMGSGKPLESVSRSVMSELALGRLIWPGEKKVLGHVLGVLNANKTNQSQIWCSVRKGSGVVGDPGTRVNLPLDQQQLASSTQGWGTCLWCFQAHALVLNKREEDSSPCSSLKPFWRERCLAYLRSCAYSEQLLRPGWRIDN